MSRLSTGIYRGPYSIRAIVNTSIGRKEKKFPYGTALADVKRWRQEQIGKFAALKRRVSPTARRGTLRADIPKYLKQIAGLASAKSRKSELAAWDALYGLKPRAQLTEEMIRQAISRWQTEGRNVGTDEEPQWKPYSIRTCEHRVATLRHLFHVLDGADSPTPCDALTFELPPTQPVFVPAKTIMAVAKKLTDKGTRARLMVLSATAVRPSELKRAQIDDVDLESRIWWVRTAKGGRARPLYLNNEMLAAWDAFIAANAWGEYDTSRHAKLLRLAGWPTGVRPYAIRGTVGMEMSRRGVDLADIQQIMGHSDQKTTRNYYVPPEDSRLAAASKGLGGRFGWRRPTRLGQQTMAAGGGKRRKIERKRRNKKR